MEDMKVKVFNLLVILNTPSKNMFSNLPSVGGNEGIIIVYVKQNKLQWESLRWYHSGGGRYGAYFSAHSTEQIKVKVNVCLCVYYFLLVRQHLH